MTVYSNNMKVKLKKFTEKSKHAYWRLIFYKNILQFQCILCKTSLYILTNSKKSHRGCDLGSPIIGISVYEVMADDYKGPCRVISTNIGELGDDPSQ